MWLLNTTRAELNFFSTPESVPGGYAILSHVWGKDEQTFQDLQALRAQCAADGTNPRDLVCDKIREFCILAERYGHKWGWADMCCIDKTSSTELSEAITAMYRYYSLADICYVYLRDVPTASPGDLRAPDSAFRKSRWHKRGWTLQELIAPPFVVFVSKTWELLGAKADLAGLLEEITRIPIAVLKLDKTPSDYCVAARMSWAATRRTTRPEDEAYCLMGIFRIFMPPLYGEGRNAFLRLQEEIMTQVEDPSIFVWGGIGTLDETFVQRKRWYELRPQIGFGRAVALFAHSPADFLDGHRIKWHAECPQPPADPLHILKFWTPSADLSKLPTFDITPYGIKAHIPVFTNSYNGDVVTLLLGIKLEVSGSTTQNLGLLLRPVKSPDHTRQLYVPCDYGWSESNHHIVDLDPDHQEFAVATGTTLEWRTIYIVRRAVDPPKLQAPMVNASLCVPFHIPRLELEKFQDLVDNASCSLRPPNPTYSVWQRHVALKVDLFGGGIMIYLGLCGKASLDRPQHWARIVEYKSNIMERVAEERWGFVYDGNEEVEHVCAEHHVDEWPRQIHLLTMYNDHLKKSGLVALRRSLELSFEPYPLSLTNCRKVNIKVNTTGDDIGSKDRGSESKSMMKLAASTHIY